MARKAAKTTGQAGTHAGRTRALPWALLLALLLLALLIVALCWITWSRGRDRRSLEAFAEQEDEEQQRQEDRLLGDDGDDGYGYGGDVAQDGRDLREEDEPREAFVGYDGYDGDGVPRDINDPGHSLLCAANPKLCGAGKDMHLSARLFLHQPGHGRKNDPDDPYLAKEVDQKQRVRVRAKGVTVAPGNDPNLGVTVFATGNDGATAEGNAYQGGLASWWGIGFRSKYDHRTRFMHDTRTGLTSIDGDLEVADKVTAGRELCVGDSCVDGEGLWGLLNPEPPPPPPKLSGDASLDSLTLSRNLCFGAADGGGGGGGGATCVDAGKLGSLLNPAPQAPPSTATLSSLNLTGNVCFDGYCLDRSQVRAALERKEQPPPPPPPARLSGDASLDSLQVSGQLCVGGSCVTGDALRGLLAPKPPPPPPPPPQLSGSASLDSLSLSGKLCFDGGSCVDGAKLAELLRPRPADATLDSLHVKGNVTADGIVSAKRIFTQPTCSWRQSPPGDVIVRCNDNEYMTQYGFYDNTMRARCCRIITLDGDGN